MNIHTEYPNKITIPELLSKNVVIEHGARGQAWLAELPRILNTLSQAWRLSELKPYSNLSYNFVASARRFDGVPVVLKVAAVPQALSSEAEALRLYARAKVESVVKVLEEQPDGSALLLEQIRPGEPLSSLQSDGEATVIAARVIRALWRPAPAQHSLRLLPDWCASLLNATPSSPLPWSLLEQAQQVLASLLHTAPSPVLLHGDLHHENILRAAGNQWRVIDPKGLVGDPSYEVAAFLLNPATLESRIDAREILLERMALLATDLGLERKRIASWGFVQAVLSLCWMAAENPAEWQGTLRLARMLAELRTTH